MVHVNIHSITMSYFDFQMTKVVCLQHAAEEESIYNKETD